MKRKIKITILKDRPTGVSRKKIKLYYNNKTMRLTSNELELNKKYKWEEDFKVKYNNYIEKKLVCNNNEEKEIYG